MLNEIIWAVVPAVLFSFLLKSKHASTGLCATDHSCWGPTVLLVITAISLPICVASTSSMFLYIPSRQPVPVSTSYVLPFYMWALTGVLFPSSCHLCLTFCSSACTAPELGGGDSVSISWLSWTPLLSRALSQGNLPSRYLKRPDLVLFKSKRCCCCLPYTLSILNSSWSL